MTMAPEDLVNQAIVTLGYTDRIASFYEGSAAAMAALEVYGQVRDELLDAGDWPLARRANIPLALLKGPPPPGGFTPAAPWSARYAPPGWLYEYAYPTDMLELRAVLPRPGFMFDLDPRPALWRVDNDNSLVDASGAPMAEVKVILANIPAALATYIGQVTDPALWEPGFTKVVVDRLAEKLARVLANELQKRDAQAELGVDLPAAETARG